MQKEKMILCSEPPRPGCLLKWHNVLLAEPVYTIFIRHVSKHTFIGFSLDNNKITEHIYKGYEPNQNWFQVL